MAGQRMALQTKVRLPLPAVNYDACHRYTRRLLLLADPRSRMRRQISDGFAIHWSLKGIRKSLTPAEPTDYHVLNHDV